MHTGKNKCDINIVFRGGVRLEVQPCSIVFVIMFSFREYSLDKCCSDINRAYPPVKQQYRFYDPLPAIFPILSPHTCSFVVTPCQPLYLWCCICEDSVSRSGCRKSVPCGRNPRNGVWMIQPGCLIVTNTRHKLLFLPL